MDPAEEATAVEDLDNLEDVDEVSDEIRKLLVEELARQSRFTVDDLREQDDEFLIKLVESAGLDTEDLAARLEEVQHQALDEDLLIGGAWSSQQVEQEDQDRGNSVAEDLADNDDIDVGGYMLAGQVDPGRGVWWEG